MKVEGIRSWSKHATGHDSTWLSRDDARLVVKIYDFLVEMQDDAPYEWADQAAIFTKEMKGVSG